MKLYIFLIAALAVTSKSFAQDQVKISDVLDLEDRIMVKKMTDELNKPNPNAPAPAPLVIAPKPPKIVYPTETLAVYGTSATFYEGRLSMGGRTYTVRTGTPVQEYTVSNVTPYGIELTKLVSAKKQRGKRKSNVLDKQVTFAPLVVH